MRKPKALIKKLENKFNIEIVYFMYYSGSIKASLTLRKFNESKGYFTDKIITVNRNETYESAIEKSLMPKEIKSLRYEEEYTGFID